MIKTFYVYLHHRADSGEIFYVGKGTRHSRDDNYKRAHDASRRKRMWKGVAQKHGVIVTVQAEFFDEPDAIAHEAELISLHGRREAGAGPLVNHTDGGYGASGYRHKKETLDRMRAAQLGRTVAPETRAKLSASLSGSRHPGWGRKQSSATSERKRASMLGVQRGGNSPLAKSVVDEATGRVFPSTRDAAEFLGIPMSTLAKKLNGRRTNNTSMRFA